MFVEVSSDDDDSQNSQPGTIQTLYTSISNAIRNSSANAHSQDSEDPQQQTLPQSQSPEHPAEDTWYMELLGILELLGAAKEDSNAPPQHKTESNDMSWLTDVKSRLDTLASQAQHMDWSAFMSFETDSPQSTANTASSQPDTNKSAESSTQAESLKKQILDQIGAVQAQLNQRIDDARAVLEDVVQHMLPPQLQKAWVAECAQACIDKEIHPELLQTTSVRLGHDVCKQEAEFQQKRARHIHHSFAEFIGEPVESIDPRDIPIIGIAGSGGGFRAMVATLGSYRAMHLAGLAQCVTYDAAVSGSSWAIAALHTYANGNPLKVLDSVHEAMKTSMFSTANLSGFITENDGMAKRVFADIAARYLLSAASSSGSGSSTAPSGSQETTNTNNLQSASAAETLLDRIADEISWQSRRALDTLFPGRTHQNSNRPVPLTMDELLSAAKTVFKTVSVPPLSIVDLYGALLFRKLVVQHLKSDDDKGPSLQLDSQWVRLSAQSAAVDQGQLPMPLYTAVRHFIGTDDNDPDKAQVSKYQWFEFSPYEVGSIDHGAWIPSWAFGRPMVDGREQFKIGEAHFGGILGAASSAFCASVKAMLMEIYMAVPAAVRSAMDPLLDRIEHGSEIAHPIPPYTLYNPFYQIASSSAKLAELGSKPLLSLMDAGMDNNLPFAPLLRPERGVDVIVCLDASANIEIMPWFARAEAWASDHGVERWPWGVRPWAADPLRPSKAEAELDQSTLSGTRSVRQSMNKRIRDDNIRCVVFDQPVALSPLPKPKSLPCPITVLYLPLLPNPNFRDPGFDPETADFCGTFNDKWSSEQVDLLADLASFNMSQEIERIREAVKVAYKRKRAHRLYREGL
ncbi:hypothetical protein EV183_004511 [Coemansia sp. RSA 2336]|nr:hypothetical protein EV183_004511 [Coemansia sp. RSA 2336]